MRMNGRLLIVLALLLTAAPTCLLSEKVASAKFLTETISLDQVFNFKTQLTRILGSECNPTHNNAPFQCIVVLNCSKPCEFWKRWLENPFVQFSKKLSSPERSVVIYIHDPYNSTFRVPFGSEPSQTDDQDSGGWLVPRHDDHVPSDGMHNTLAIIEHHMKHPTASGQAHDVVISWLKFDLPNSTYIDYFYIFGYYLELRLRSFVNI